MPVIEEVKNLEPEMKKWRQDIHRNPEMGMEVQRTADKVEALLESWNIEVGRISRTGVVGILRSGTSEKSVGLRADMDALRLNEVNDVEYKSETDGVMHACGHDGHTAMLLGAAKHLSQTKDFDGTVYFIFQPAEEGVDGADIPESGGAEVMINDGFFEQFPCDEIYGMHNFPNIPKDTFVTTTGPILAACDEFKVTINGGGGHASQPDNTQDVLLAGVEMIQKLKEFEMGAVKDMDPKALLGICGFHAGSESFNVIPSQSWFGGTPRFLNSEVQELLKDGIDEIGQTIAEKHNVEVNLEYSNGYPVLKNAQEGVDHVAKAATEVVGSEKVITSMPPQMGAEDFAFFLENRPGAMVFLGQGEEGRECGNIHSPTYDFNDDILAVGASFWVKLVEECLKEGGKNSSLDTESPANAR